MSVPASALEASRTRACARILVEIASTSSLPHPTGQPSAIAYCHPMGAANIIERENLIDMMAQGRNLLEEISRLDLAAA